MGALFNRIGTALRGQSTIEASADPTLSVRECRWALAGLLLAAVVIGSLVGLVLP
jgi:hypothetical protein